MLYTLYTILLNKFFEKKKGQRLSEWKKAKPNQLLPMRKYFYKDKQVESKREEIDIPNYLKQSQSDHRHSDKVDFRAKTITKEGHLIKRQQS